MKNRLLKIILFSLMLLLSGTNSTILNAQENEAESLENSSLEILEILREDKNILDYFLRRDDKAVLSSGIETFAVDDEERIYLSNYATGKILVFHKNELIEEINISAFSQPRDIAVNAGFLYIFEDTGKISGISLADKETVKEFTVPAIMANTAKQNVLEIGLPVCFIKDYFHSQISVYYSNDHVYFPFHDTKGGLPLDEYRLPVAGDRVYKRLLSLDKYKNIYILGTEIEDKEDRIEIREIVCKYSYTGELLGIFETINDKNYITPYNYISVSESGNTYQLLILEESVKVYRLDFTEVNELVLSSEENTEDEADDTGKNALGAAEDYTKRIALYNKAVELINLRWIYNPRKNASRLSDVFMPYYLQGIDEEREMEGIPYCWGGFDSLHKKSTNQKWDNFLDAIDKGAAAGNLGITPNYIPGTAGLDCSGFIAAALGLVKREPSWNFLYSRQFTDKITYNELLFMDLLVKNGHMFFYFDDNNYGITSIETNTMGSEWKVKFFNWSWRALRDMEYCARRYKGLDD